MHSAHVTRTIRIVAVLAASGALPALAEEAVDAATAPVPAGPKLPLDLAFCMDRAQLESKMAGAREVTDDTLEMKAKVFGTDGFVNAILEDDKLVAVRYRAFWTDAAQKRIRGALEGELGPGAQGRSATNWSLDLGRTVELKVQTEQLIYVNYEIPYDSCGGLGPHDGSLSEQEKRDLEATRKKDAVDFDPYTAKDPGAETLVEKRIEDGKKKDEEQREQKKEEDKDVKDGDIDW